MHIQALNLLKRLRSNKLWVDFFIAATEIWQRGIIQHVIESMTIPLEVAPGIELDKRYTRARDHAVICHVQIQALILALSVILPCNNSDTTN